VDGVRLLDLAKRRSLDALTASKLSIALAGKISATKNSLRIPAT
jgi:hypothetical protein